MKSPSVFYLTKSHLLSLSEPLSAITIHAFTRCLSIREHRHYRGPHAMPPPLQFVIISRLATPAAGIYAVGTHLPVLAQSRVSSALSAIRRNASFPSISPSSILITVLHVKQPPSAMTSPQTPTPGNPIISDRIFLGLSSKYQHKRPVGLVKTHGWTDRQTDRWCSRVFDVSYGFFSLPPL